MHEIFLNYRTKGGKEAAYLCDHVLSARFGRDSVFLAQKSIDPGKSYDDFLVRAVRRSRVMLALIHEQWLDAPHRKLPGGRALDDPTDWVRRELEEALEAGVLIVPLLVGRNVEQLDPHRLPRPIADLAEHQYTRVLLSTVEADLTRLADRLVRQVPSLATVDRGPRTGTAAKAEPAAPEPTVDNDGQSGGVGNVGGSVGTFVNTANAPMHTGSGDQVNGPSIKGNNYGVAGDNQGGIHQGFGTRPPRGGEERTERGSNER
ncbi:TIR protein [Actinobacteria bacterium OK074]|nr:TIR protein [Actinobacteria bacterium OK074]